MDISCKWPFVFGIASESDKLRRLHEELDVFFAHELAVDIHLFYASVEAHVDMLPFAFEILDIFPAGVFIPSVIAASRRIEALCRSLP